ncbi:hypothetical protein V8E36_005418 [Tilletia maclaganii]
MISRPAYQTSQSPSPVSLARAHSNASLSPSIAPPLSPSTSPIPSATNPRSPSIRQLRSIHATSRKSLHTAGTIGSGGIIGPSGSLSSSSISNAAGLGISPSPSPTPPPFPNEHQRKLFYYRTRQGDRVNPDDAESVGGHSSTNPARSISSQHQRDDQLLGEDGELEHLSFDNEAGPGRNHSGDTEESLLLEGNKENNNRQALPVLQSSVPSAAHTTESDYNPRDHSSGSGSTSTTAAEMGPVDTEDTDPEPSSVFSSPTSTFYGLQTASVKPGMAAANGSARRIKQNASGSRLPRRTEGHAVAAADYSNPASGLSTEAEDDAEPYSPAPLPNLPRTKSKRERGVVAHMRGRSSIDLIGSSLLTGAGMLSPTDDMPAVPPVPASITGTLAALNAPPAGSPASRARGMSVASPHLLQNGGGYDTSRLSAQDRSSSKNTAKGLARASQRTSRSVYSDDSAAEHSDRDGEAEGSPRSRGSMGDEEDLEDLEGDNDDDADSKRYSRAARTTRSSFGNLGPLPPHQRMSNAQPGSRRSSAAANKRLSGNKRSSQSARKSKRLSMSGVPMPISRRSVVAVAATAADMPEHEEVGMTTLDSELSPQSAASGSGGLTVQDAGGSNFRRGSAGASSDSGLRSRGANAEGGGGEAQSFWRRPSAPALTTSMRPGIGGLSSPRTETGSETFPSNQSRTRTPTVQLSAVTPPTIDVANLGPNPTASPGHGGSRLSPRLPTVRSLSVSSGMPAASRNASGAEGWSKTRTAPSSPALSSQSQELSFSTDASDSVIGSKSELLLRLLSDQARIDAQNYSVLASMEVLDDAKAELKRLETRIADAKRKVKVEMRIRDAAVALRKAYKGALTTSARDRLSTGTRLSVGGASAFGSRPNSPAASVAPPLPSGSSASTISAVTGAVGAGKTNRRERTNSVSTSVSGISASASGAATPTTIRSMSLSPAERARAEAKAEADVTAATVKVDSVTQDLYALSDRAATLRAAILEHQSRVLVHRVESLEAELLNSGGRSADEERKAIERERSLLDEKAKNLKAIEQLRAEAESSSSLHREKDAKLEEVSRQIQRLEKQLRESEEARSAQAEAHEAMVKQHAEVSRQRDSIVTKHQGAEEAHRAAISYHTTRTTGLESALELAKCAVDAAKRELEETKTEVQNARAATKGAEDRTALAVEEERLKRVDVQRLADDERIKRSDLEDQVEGLESRARSAEDQVHRLEEQLVDAKASISDLEKDLVDAKTTGSEALAEVEQLKLNLARTETQLKDTRVELSQVSKEIEKRFEDRVTRLTAESEVGKAAFKAQAELEKRVKGQQSELASMQKQIDAAKEQIAAETKRRQAAEERDLDLVTNISKLESEKKRAQDQIAQLTKELEGQRTAAKNALREQLAAESQCSKLEAQIKDLGAQITVHQDSSRNAQAERETLESKIVGHLSEIAKLAGVVKQHQETARSVKSDHEQALVSLQRSADEHQTAASKAKADHETALKELQHLTRELGEQNVQLEAARNEAKSEAKLRDEFETQNEKLEASIEQLTAQIASLSEQKDQAVKELKAMRTESEKLQAESKLAQQFEDRNEELEEEIEQLKLAASGHAAELEKVRSDTTAVEAAKKAFAAEMEQVKADGAKTVAELEQLKTAASEITADLEKARADASAAEAEKTKLQAEIEELKAESVKRAAELEQLQASASALEEAKQALEEEQNAHEETKDELAKAIDAVDEHEEALQASTAKMDAASAKLGEVLGKLQQSTTKLKSVTDQLEKSEAKVTAAEKQFHDLELAVTVERKQMAERDELYHAFELRLENAEKRLRAEDERCARLLGKFEGRDTMDDLLAQIKTGSSSAKKRTAGQDIAELMTSLSEHITDLADELSRLGGGGTSRVANGGANSSSGDEAEKIQSLEEEVELLESEAVKWKRDADQMRQTLEAERKANEETQEELVLMEEEAMRWKRDAEEARKLLGGLSKDQQAGAPPSIASLATIKKLVSASPPPPRELPGATPEEKLANAVVELDTCRQAMHAISALLPDLNALGPSMASSAAHALPGTIGLGLMGSPSVAAAEDAATTAERVHAGLVISRVEQYKSTLQNLLRNHAQLRNWHATARQREKRLEATIVELRHSLDEFRKKSGRAELLASATASPSTPTKRSPHVVIASQHTGASGGSASQIGVSSVGYNPRQLSNLPAGVKSRLGGGELASSAGALTPPSTASPAATD